MLAPGAVESDWARYEIDNLAHRSRSEAPSTRRRSLYPVSIGIELDDLTNGWPAVAGLPESQQPTTPDELPTLLVEMARTDHRHPTHG